MVLNCLSSQSSISQRLYGLNALFKVAIAAFFFVLNSTLLKPHLDFTYSRKAAIVVVLPAQASHAKLIIQFPES